MKYQAKANKKGETLIEVIAALTSLVLAGIAVMTLIISVMNSTAISKEYLIAQNLAREGMEGVTNIRDTNWLLYPSKKTDCWMIIDSSACLGTQPVINEDYRLAKTASGNFKLEKSVLWDDTLKSNDYFKIQSQPAFYRKIEFTQIDSDTAQVTVTVAWMNKSTVTKYELSSVLVNYEK
jgi:hypothetical protein